MNQFLRDLARLENEIIFKVFVLLSCTLPRLFQCWQWEVGAVAIVLAYLNLLGDIRQFPFLGIYVIMFFDILKTFLKFAIVFFVFIVAFGLGFHHLIGVRVVSIALIGWPDVARYVSFSSISGSLPRSCGIPAKDDRDDDWRNGV
jgi:hypothetical protein